MQLQTWMGLCLLLCLTKAGLLLCAQCCFLETETEGEGGRGCMISPSPTSHTLLPCFPPTFSASVCLTGAALSAQEMTHILWTLFKLKKQLWVSFTLERALCLEFRGHTVELYQYVCCVAIHFCLLLLCLYPSYNSRSYSFCWWKKTGIHYSLLM